MFFFTFEQFCVKYYELGVINLIDILIHILEHSFEDTWLTIPILLVTYIIIEYFERKPSQNDDKIFFGLQKFGPILGALLGLLPQCGFSILAAMLFIQRNITLGTMLSVFIATSDEAIPVLLSNPSMYTSLPLILVLKLIIAILVGYIVDHIFKQEIIKFDEMEEEEIEEEDYEEANVGSNCPCCYTEYPMIISVILRTLKIYAFIFITTFIFTGLIEWISEETLQSILLTNSIFQPIIAALFGFIPNCAATVILTQLYISQTLTFGSLMAGLITNAGLGILVLIQYQARKKDILKTISILLITAIITGFLCTLIA